MSKRKSNVKVEPVVPVVLAATFAAGLVWIFGALWRSDEPSIRAGGPIVPGGRVLSKFGQRGARFHYGIDISAATGTPVLAAMDGIVASAYRDGEVSGYGNVVTVSHGPFGTLYSHMDSIAVRTGERIVAGQLVGRVGSTNSEGGFHTSGPHLHFEVIVPPSNVMHGLAHYTGSTPPRIDPEKWAADNRIVIG